ncbi:MAG: DUF2919 family protein [Gammaproteobacteria bacterium]|nr:DUF2919 family protein [Gammaproteobacteria bacterium]
MPNQYPFNAYDKNLCLKLNPGLWLVIIFLLRPYIIAIFSLVNMSDRMSLIRMVGPGTGMTISTIMAFPAIMVIYAWIKRTPDASARVRWIWRHGRELLAASALLTIIYILAIQLFFKTIKLNLIGVLPIVICPVILYYLYKSQHVRDIFSDFPENKSQKTE